jgi:hypothetical protein
MKARSLPTPLSGLFRSPCGAWVALYRMNSGAGWFRPLAACTRQGVLTAERSK